MLMNVWNMKSLNKGGRGMAGQRAVTVRVFATVCWKSTGGSSAGHSVVRIIQGLFMVEKKIFASFSPGKTFTKITPEFLLGSEVKFYVSLDALASSYFLLVTVKRGHTQEKDSIRSPRSVQWCRNHSQLNATKIKCCFLFPSHCLLGKTPYN